MLSLGHILECDVVFEGVLVLEGNFARGTVELLPDGLVDIAVDRWFSVGNIELYSIFAAIEGAAEGGLLVVDAFENVLIGRPEVEGGRACLQRVRPLQAQLVVSLSEAGNGPLGIEL